ncbi:RING-CH-type domain-containing protein [Heracleum sosnowskyi]|uniref:RING-CH-type domain-containing protein n=1 Tax=Heracleum sosnowskyi TaxID=360622 RepID=A0AAD8MJP7_9APIA|nr:RING-CH-type domain-containing protein [Heracleum sosnowskyi]
MDEVLSEQKRVGQNVDLCSAPGSVNQEVVEDLRGSDNRVALEMESGSEKEGVVGENVDLGSVNREMVENLGGSNNRVSLDMEIVSQKEGAVSENVDLRSVHGSVNQIMVENLGGSDHRVALETEILSEKEGVGENVDLSLAQGSVNKEMVEKLGGSDNRAALETEILSDKGGVGSENVDLSYGHGSGNQEIVEYSRGLDNRVAVEMTIVIKPVEGEGSDNKDLIDPNMTSKVLEDEVKVTGLEDDKQSSCVIDVTADESSDLEWVCRICHLTSDQSLETIGSTSCNERELIQLGCGCKDELGAAHSYCAEAWFKLKGNRLCEICGETAKNIIGIADNRFVEEWNIRMLSDYGIQSSERSGGCWRGQPFCNFLLACLVIAFVLPWFFRVEMF